MIAKFNLLAILFTGLSLTSVAYSAPVNDNYANAIALSGSSGSVMTSNVGATKEPGEPNVALNRGGASLWYKWTSPGTGVLKIDTNGTAINTLVGIYVGGTVASAQLLAGSDYCDCAYIGTIPGQTYFISVDGIYSSGNPLQSSIQLNYSFLNSAPNDNFANAIPLFGGAPIRTTQITTTNVGASKEAGEPNHAGNAGGKSLWFKYNSSFTLPQTISMHLVNNKVGAPAVQSHALMALYSGTSLGTLTPVQSFSSEEGTIVFKAQSNLTYYIAIDGFDAGQGAETANFTLTWGLNKSSRMADIDGDGNADQSVYRPTTGTWYSLGSVDNTLRAGQWGTNGDKPLMTDANDNGRSDYTVFRPDTGVWYLNRDNVASIFNWGLATDVPLIMTTYSNGLSVDRPVVFRPSTGEWWLTGFNSRVTFGQSGDIPMTGDFDGDGTDDLCIFRPSNGTWYIWILATGQYRITKFGIAGDKPVPADYDGDGQQDIAVYRPSTGVWYVLQSTNGSFMSAQFGTSTDIPQPGDYDGDSRADMGIYRNGAWWVLSYPFSSSVKVTNFGLATDIPVTAPVN
jgi:hypothetical protein